MENSTKMWIVSNFLFLGLNGHGQNNDIDSLRNPFSQYYLTDMNLRDVAQLIVEDSIQPVDNIVTLSILDSVVQGNEASRNYFADAFDVIIIKSDGALSEVIGQYCITSIYNNPNELLKWLSSGRFESSPESIAQYIVYELIMSENPEKKKEELVYRIIRDSIKTSRFLKLSNNFIEIVNKDFELQIKE